MRSTNLHLVDKNKIPVFILSCVGMEYFLHWSDSIRNDPTVTNIQLIVVDNGSQDLSKLNVPSFQTSQNVGCAGGWNLISQIAFNYFGMEKIIIGQDDGMFDTNMLLNVWNNTDDDTIAGAYDRSFEFSLFGITKNLWNAVGMFDENFIYVGCEDNDYKHRVTLLSKKVSCLNYSANMNGNLTSKYLGDQLTPSNLHNANYIKEKWGDRYQYTHPFNDPVRTANECVIRPEMKIIYGDITKFPSVLEFESLV